MASSHGSHLRASGPARVCLRVSVSVLRALGPVRREQWIGRTPLPAPLPGAPGRQARFGGGGWLGWRVRVAVSVSVRARAAENQEVTAAKRTQTCLIAVT